MKTEYLIGLAIIMIFLMTAVSALELQSHDFDGHFKMDVPKNSSFKLVNDSYDTGAVYIDEKNDINITYNDNINYSGRFGSFTFDFGTKMYEEGNYTIVEFSNGSNFVSLPDENRVVVIQSPMEVKDIESMLDTVEFRG